MICGVRAVSSVEDFFRMLRNTQLAFASNFGDVTIPGLYEFSTDGTDLMEKLRLLSVESARLDDETAKWELFWCDGCSDSHSDFPLHVRLTF